MIPRTPTRTIRTIGQLVALVALPCAAVWWATAPLRTPEPEFATRLADVPPNTGDLDSNTIATESTAGLRFPPRAYAAQLYVDLFPPPPPVEQSRPTPPPVRLDARLIAITGGADDRAAFVRLEPSSEYVALRLGDELPSGFRLTAFEELAAVFTHKERTARLELPR